MTTESNQPQPSLPPHRKVHVDLGPRAYDVVIGRGLLDHVGSLLKDRVHGPVAIVSDDTVAGLFAYRVEHQSSMKALQPFCLPPFAAGESGKSMMNASRLLSNLAEKKVSRSGTVIGLGGGVVGDLAGFVAATYLRGVDFVQIPTTLLAMVDSSVGGKTGVNLPEGKNLVGAFHQPKLVIVDLDTLNSFAGGSREFPAGMAEVIKYGAICDKVLFERVSKRVRPDVGVDLDEIVEKCVAIKARIVENDEFETKGERALLNFGHTIGHAIEKVTTFRKQRAHQSALDNESNYLRNAAIEKANALPSYLHGEAISLGMRAAAWLSVWHLGLPEADARRIEAALTVNYLPLVLKPEVDRAAILAALGNDKKVAADGRNRWVLLKSLGEATSGHELTGDLVERAVDLLYS